MTLRARLLTVLVALVTCGLVVTGATSAFALRTYLVNRIDDQLRDAVTIAGASPLIRSSERTDLLRTAVAPTEYIVQVRRQDGTIEGISGPPGLPPATLLDRAPATPAGGPASAPTTVDAGPAGRFRVVAFTAGNGRARAVVGLPLRPADETVGRLVLIEAVTGVVVLLLLAALAHRLIVRGLRPLDDIAATAGAIAAGDLDQRVPVGSSRTEAGRLALAVNGMLARIQSAIEARSQSEDRLRRFVADASHELRTPLTSVRGYLQMLRHGVVTEAGRPDAVRRADDEAARMSKIVDDLLYLARMDQEPRLRLGPVDLSVIAADSVADALAVQPDRPLALEAGGPCEVVADEDAIRQILANLLGNIRAHTPPDAAATVTVRAEDDAAVIEVCDRGPGMPPDVAERAFDRFFRAAAVRPETRGSGLGLPIVAAIAQAHGGSATIDSRLAEGTTVRVRLPRRA